MNSLSLNQMENVQGGRAIARGGSRGRSRAWGCAGAVLGIIGLAAAVALTPVTGGLSAWFYVGTYSGAFATGISIADCAGVA